MAISESGPGVAFDCVAGYLERRERRSQVRLITCGSVDDGKSTLVGRLLYDSHRLFDDQLATLAQDSERVGARDGRLDFALVVDGLAAEREQGITIDVAHRLFSSESRRFVLADTPGHEQYTRNMVTAASSADVAVVLIDATKGIVSQTRRHLFLLALLQVPHVIAAINKMDLVGYSARVFEDLEHEFLSFAARVGIADARCIPLSAMYGKNVVRRDAELMAWYAGPTLLGCLENLSIDDDERSTPFRLPVQCVIRAEGNFRGYGGAIASGTVEVGDSVMVLPSGRSTTIAGLFVGEHPTSRAGVGQSVTITLGDETDVSRGDLLVGHDAPSAVSQEIEAAIVWMSDAPLLQGRSYLLKHGTRNVSAAVSAVRYRVDIDTFLNVPTRLLQANDIGICELELSSPIAFERYCDNRDLGGFILIDRLTNDTLGAGMVRRATHRSQNVRWQPFDIDRPARAALKGQRPCVIWLTGLSGAGKSTIANVVERRLYALGCHTYLLDGDNVRHGLNKDLGFTDGDRVENIRRLAEVCRLMTDAGLIVLASCISPFRAERQMARELFEPGEFIEVFVDTPIEVAECRDPKGLYRKARRGELRNFTGVDSPYEVPQSPELRIETAVVPPELAADQILRMLRAAAIIDG